MIQTTLIERTKDIPLSLPLQRLADLKKLDYWKRGEYVQKQGWATMPGEKEADSGLADECARRLAELKL